MIPVFAICDLHAEGNGASIPSLQCAFRRRNQTKCPAGRDRLPSSKSSRFGGHPAAATNGMIASRRARLELSRNDPDPETIYPP